MLHTCVQDMLGCSLECSNGWTLYGKRTREKVVDKVSCDWGGKGEDIKLEECVPLHARVPSATV